MMNTTTVTRPLLVLLALLLTLPAQAQSLANQAPANASLYVGWRGADDMGPAYEGSHLQGVIEETGLLEAVPQLIDALRELGENEEMPPELAELMSMGGTLWSAAWSNGGAMYMVPPQEDGPPIPGVAFLIKKGEDPDALEEALGKLVKMINEAEELPAFMGQAGDAFFLSLAFDAGAVEGAKLSGSDRFRSAMAKVQGDGALSVYVDVQSWIGTVDQFAEMMRQQAAEFDSKDPFAEMWPTLRDASGLAGVKRLSMSSGIKDKKWHTHFYMDAPAPRSGILSLVDTQPIKPEHLTHVPKTATYLQVFTMDPARVLDVTREVLGAVEPGMVKQLDDGLASASKEVGVDLERELIDGMGPVWSVYIDPMIAGNGLTSLVMVNELADAESVEEALTKLSDAANAAMAEAMEDGPINIRLLSREVKGTTISHLGIPYIAPAWMVHKGRLYVSLFPQGLEMAIEQSGKQADSILANATYKKTLAQFGDKQLTGLSFTDLPETAADGYGINLMLVQIFAGAGEMIAGKPSQMRMPPVGKLMPFIEPAATAAWVDDDGVYMHGIEPFPLSALLGPAKGMESSMAVSGPLAVGVLLPALGSARQAARQAQGMNQARQVSMAAIIYATDNRNQLPDDVAKLPAYIGGAEAFITPDSIRAEAPPFNFDQWEDARQAKFLRENSSFVVVPCGPMNEVKRPAETVLVFQRPDDVLPGRALSVGFVDGHVEQFADADALNAMLKKQTGKTIEQLIKRQEDFGG